MHCPDAEYHSLQYGSSSDEALEVSVIKRYIQRHVNDILK